MCTVYTHYGVARSFIVYVPRRRRMSRTSLVGATVTGWDGGRRIKEREDKRGRRWGRREIKCKKKKKTRRYVILYRRHRRPVDFYFIPVSIQGDLYCFKNYY